MHYIKSYSNNSEYETAKTSADFWFPHVGYIEDTKEVKWLNSKKDLYNIYGTLTGDSATATITINNSGYTVSPSGADNEFGLVLSEPVTELSFSNQGKIKTLDKLDIDTSAVTDMRYMFSGCTSLTSIDLSSFNTSAVTSMLYMFGNCHALTSLDLSSFNTSAVSSMGYMFSGCTSLTSLDLSSFNTSAVTYMGFMFNNCRALTSLDLSSFNTSAVSNMRTMFSGCSGLTSLDLSNFNTSAVTNMNTMFSGCSGLTTLTMNNTNQTTFDMIKARLVSDSVVSRVTIIRDGVNWKYQNGTWVVV